MLEKKCALWAVSSIPNELSGIAFKNLDLLCLSGNSGLEVGLFVCGSM